MRPKSRQRGFSLLEVVFAIAVLAIGGLMLTAAMSSSEQMSSMARERSIANSVVRAYIERLRQQYPKQNSSSMIELVVRGMPGSADESASAQLDKTTSGSVPDSTPVYDLTKLYNSGTIERSVLRNCVANVWFCTDETGANWGPAVTASLNTPTAAIASIASSAIAAADQTSLGLPRDLNGDGTATETNTVAFHFTGKTILLVPMKIQLEWTSGSGRSVVSGNKQSLTIYALFSPQH
ncbi:MAG: prepilin-type N-terminal cleavage/methylation domain-containing protein [Planctomycetota bacterium]